jgi:hypothetical protein
MNAQTWWDAACNMQPGDLWMHLGITSGSQFKELRLLHWAWKAHHPHCSGASSEESFMLLCFMSEAFDI